MIYNCQHCNAPFSSEHLREALKNKERIITCVYCNKPNEISSVRSSHVSRGFDYLSVGDFYFASMEFANAIDDAKKDPRIKTAPQGAYFGYALSQFRVQLIFSDKDKLSEPKLICHHYNEEYIQDNENYRLAVDSRPDLLSAGEFAAERTNIEEYAKKIDLLKDYYDEIRRERNDANYSVFIAYEDEPLDEESKGGYRTALKVRNSLPDSIRSNSFMPDLDNNKVHDLRYEASILYALDHSNCMLVIADNNIDSRLTSIYSRYYHKIGNENNMCFIRYLNAITINLPDRRAASNVVNIDNSDEYIKFVCERNGLIWFNNSSSAPPQVDEIIQEEEYNQQGYTILKGKQISFGSYPQKEKKSAVVESFFSQFEKPNAEDAHGWTVMYCSASGRPYCWYLDKNVPIKDGVKKYRAVYFKKYRDVFAIQPSDQGPREQRKNNYKNNGVYYFEFSPIKWNLVDMSNDIAVLITDKGIDSREYNGNELVNDWDNSSIREWLNNEFKNTAFSEEQQKLLCSMTGYDSHDKVFLITKKFDLTKRFVSRIIPCTDYMKCVGGMGENSINSYWIQAGERENDDRAPVLFPDINKYGIAEQFVDCTTVTVVPKIIIRLDKKV